MAAAVAAVDSALQTVERHPQAADLAAAVPVAPFWVHQGLTVWAAAAVVLVIFRR
jgi:hypothetical protein